MKRLIMYTLVFIIGLSVIACSSEPIESNNSKQETKKETFNLNNDKKNQLYIEVSALGNQDYFYEHKLGMEKVVKDLGVRTEYVGPEEYNISAMIEDFERAISKKPNGIVVVGFDALLNPVIKKAMAGGIPVVTVDADLPDSGRVSFVGTDNFKAGKLGGEKLVELINSKGKVVILAKCGQSNHEERISGYKAVLGMYPNIEIVQVIDTQSDQVVAAKAVTNALKKYPDLDAIVCVEEAGSEGAATAVKEAGLIGKVKIIAMDRGRQVLQGIEDGVISATVVQQTALMPYYAVQILYNLNNSELSISSDDKSVGLLGVPASIDTGVIIVDKSNCEYFIN